MAERTEAPRYQTIRAQIYNDISSGKIKVGELIPSETALMEQFQASRTTVRKAIEHLSKEGIIIRKRGVGSIVNKKVVAPNVKLRGSFDDLLDVAHNTMVKVVRFEYVEASPEVCKQLKLKDGSQVLRIDRIRYMNKSPFMYSINYLPDAIGQFFTKMDLEKTSLLELVPRQCKVTLDKAMQEFNATIADNQMAEYLNIPLGFPLLRIDRVTFAKKELPVNLFYGYFRSDIYKFTTEFSL